MSLEKIKTEILNLVHTARRLWNNRYQVDSKLNRMPGSKIGT